MGGGGRGEDPHYKHRTEGGDTELDFGVIHHVELACCQFLPDRRSHTYSVYHKKKKSEFLQNKRIEYGVFQPLV